MFQINDSNTRPKLLFLTITESKIRWGHWFNEVNWFKKYINKKCFAFNSITKSEFFSIFLLKSSNFDFFRPLSSASTTTKLAENLSNEIQILVGPSPTSSRSIQGQRSARSQRSQRSLTEQRKKKSSTGVTTTSQRVSETRNTSSKLGRDSGSLRNESSIGMADPVSRSGRKTADEPDYETGRLYTI